MKSLKGLSMMTVMLAGVGVLANHQEPQAAERNASPDSTYSLNTTMNGQNNAAGFNNPGTADVASGNQSSPTANSIDNAIKIRPKRDINLGGGPVPGFIALDMAPVKELIRINPYLYGKTFHTLDDSRYHAFFSMGGMGYFSVGNGVRLGGGGLSCERHFLSDRFAPDSAISLSVKAEYGGFIVEKAFHRQDFSFYSGMQIGGGSLKVKYSGVNGNAVTASNQQYDAIGGNESAAQFALFELHGGLTYSFVSFLHVGADISVPMFYSVSGFNAFTSAFTTVNPALAVRLMIGTRG
jgi:hypothetical protein